MNKLRKRLLYAAPIPIAFLLSDHTLASFGMMMVGGSIFWIPYWLACWLSEGFSDLPPTTGGRLYQAMDINPATGEYVPVLKDQNGQIVLY